MDDPEPPVKKPLSNAYRGKKKGGVRGNFVGPQGRETRSEGKKGAEEGAKKCQRRRLTTEGGQVMKIKTTWEGTRKVNTGELNKNGPLWNPKCAHRGVRLGTH